MPTPRTSPFSLRGGRTPAIATAVAGPALPAASNAPQQASRIHPDVALLLETGHRSGVFVDATPFNWVKVTRGWDGADTTCEIQAGLDASKLGAPGTLGTGHFTHLLQRITPDRRVRVEQVMGSDKVILFQGYPMTPSFGYVETDQVVRATCVNEGQEILQTSAASQVYGRYRRVNPLDLESDDVRRVSAEVPVFNPDGKPNRSPTPLTVDGATPSATTNGKRVYVFADEGSADAGHWNFAQALAYLAWFYIQKPKLEVSAADLIQDVQVFVDVGPFSSTDAYLERMSAVCRHVTVASVDVERAIALVCDAAGLHYEVTHRVNAEGNPTHYLRVVAAIDDEFAARDSTPLTVEAPAIHDLPREKPFTDMVGRTTGDAAVANRAVQADLTTDYRSPGRALVLGGVETYEVLLLQRPGWKPFEFLDDFGLAPTTTLKTRAARDAAVAFWESEFGLGSEDDGSGRPKSKYHTGHPDHHTVRNVGRLWIFPDDTTYINADDTSPLTRVNWPAKLYSPFDKTRSNNPNVLVSPNLGAGINRAWYWVPRFRKLGDLIERSDPSVDLTPRVYFNFLATDPETALASPGWVRFSGNVVIDSKRAAIRIDEPDLLNAAKLNTQPQYPAAGLRMLEALIGLGLHTPPETNKEVWGLVPPHFFVAVRCTITSDHRIGWKVRSRRSPFRRRREAIMDTGPSRFQQKTLSPGASVIADDAADAESVKERIDSLDLRSHGFREIRLLGTSTVSGAVDVPWIDHTYRLGDSFTGAAGMGVDYRTYPEIMTIVYTNGEAAGAGYRTTLHLSDLRSAPEVINP